MSAVGLLAACGGGATPVASGSSAAASSAPTSSAAAATSAAATAASTTAASSAVSASSSAAGSVAAKGLVLDFWNPAGDTLGQKVLQGIVDKFNAQNSGFQAKDSLVASDNNYQKYTAAMAGGAPPDAIMTYDYTPMPVWAYNDALLSLDAYAAEMKIDKNDYFPIIWPMISLNGHLWGFMQEFDSGILGWNKDLFAKSGLDATKPPQTIAEFDDMNTKLTQKDASGAITQLGMAPGDSNGGSDTYFAAEFGGGYYDTLKAQFTITQEPNIAALDWMAGWWKKLGGRTAIANFKKIFTQQNDQIGFTQGRQGMMIMGEYSPIVYKKEFPELNFSAAYLPVQTGVLYGTGIAGGGNVFVVPKGVAHARESILFLKYMGGPDAVLEWNVKENNLPPVKSVAFDPNFAKQVPLMQPWLDMLKLSEQDNHLVGPITHPSVQDFNKLKSPIVANILDGKIGAREGLQQLQQQFQPVLDKYNK